MDGWIEVKRQDFLRRCIDTPEIPLHLFLPPLARDRDIAACLLFLIHVDRVGAQEAHASACLHMPPMSSLLELIFGSAATAICHCSFRRLAASHFPDLHSLRI